MLTAGGVKSVGSIFTVSGTSDNGPTAGSAKEGVTTTGVDEESVLYTGFEGQLLAGVNNLAAPQKTSGSEMK